MERNKTDTRSSFIDLKNELLNLKSEIFKSQLSSDVNETNISEFEKISNTTFEQLSSDQLIRMINEQKSVEIAGHKMEMRSFQMLNPQQSQKYREYLRFIMKRFRPIVQA